MAINPGINISQFTRLVTMGYNSLNLIQV